MISDGTGNLYGTTTYGGGGDGVVFKLDIAGRLESVLHTFSGIDGAWPTTLAMGSQGKLCGTTYGGSLRYGTLFELDPKSGALITIHSFQSGADGAFPSGGLVRDSQGNFDGATVYGGTPNLGTIFEITR